MLISMLMLAQAAAMPVEPAVAQTEPFVNSCPAAPSLVPPFGESCAAKVQASRVAAILGAQPEWPVTAERYKIINDGKVILNDRGEIVATASPCLLPTVAPQDPALVANAEPAQAAGPTDPCKTQKFAMSLLTPTEANASLKPDPKVAPKP